MPLLDHYATLGLHSGAEAIVVTAAYRALAQRYHPDRWRGDSTEAHRRMSEINEAYRVLGDAQLRAEYDATLTAGDGADFSSTEREEYEQAFGAALAGLEVRWSLAVEIFPDLAAMREALARTSTSLAFGFVTILLESKKYNERATIAATLERNFLERYFGNDGIIVAYAKLLISEGQREAAKTLNRLVDVMGSEVDPALLVQRVERQYGLTVARLRRAELETLADEVCKSGDLNQATRLARRLGYTVKEHRSGFLSSKLEITVSHPGRTPHSFDSERSFVMWVQENLCGK